MDQQKIDMFIMMNTKNFNAEQVPYIKKLMEEASDDKIMMLQMTAFKDPNTMLIISVLAGNLGIDRFMLGETGLGIAKLLTCGGLGIWTIVDWFTIMQRTRDMNFAKVQTVLLS